MRDPLPEARGRAVVVGVGNAWRNDDRAGLEVARLLDGALPAGVGVLEREGEPTALIDTWAGADAVWLADAVSSGASPGTVHRHDVSSAPLPARLYDTSTHHFGLGEALELARALGRLPERAVVFGIEGASFETGETVTGVVQEAAARVAEAIAEEVVAYTRRL